jgi:tetratricopeptide (TPR) repeat protein
MRSKRNAFAGACFGLYAFLVTGNALARSYAPEDEPKQKLEVARGLGLTNDEETHLSAALGREDYVTAEKILLAVIGPNSKSPQTAHQLAFVGSVYFLNRDYLNAAIAWKKSEAIEPLDPELRFTEAMAFIRIGHADWARDVLQSLSNADVKNALYPYWLGRLSYDENQYLQAIEHFKLAIQLDPQLARAYDNLGLCYFYLNQNDLAIASYKKAIDLDKELAHPSPWPYLNLAITQQFLNNLEDAETNLREALHFDPEFSKAHFQLGTVLEDEGKLEAALEELKEAAHLEPSYAEPHMAIARIDHRLGRKEEADSEVKIYLKLHQPDASKH